MTTNAMFQLEKKNLFTEETQNMQDKKINVSRVSNVK